MIIRELRSPLPCLCRVVMHNNMFLFSDFCVFGKFKTNICLEFLLRVRRMVKQKVQLSLCTSWVLLKMTVTRSSTLPSLHPMVLKWRSLKTVSMVRCCVTAKTPFLMMSLILGFYQSFLSPVHPTHPLTQVLLSKPARRVPHTNKY